MKNSIDVEDFFSESFMVYVLIKNKKIKELCMKRTLHDPLKHDPLKHDPLKQSLTLYLR